MADGEKVLLIEDDREIATTLRSVLEAAGYDGSYAPNGKEGQRLIEESRPALVITDMMMPQLGGFPVLEFLKQMTDPPKVIMITANEGGRHKAYAEMLGVSDYLRKPFAMDVMLEAVEKAGFKAGTDVFVALDVASSELWADGRYVFKKAGEPDRTSAQMVELYADWIRQYPIISIEDGVAESDWEGWQMLTSAIGSNVQLVGDDVFVTNPEILKRGISDKVANSLLVKLNQIGTVTETLDAVRMARDASYTTILSHRSGETEDSTIADMAVGTAAGQIKTGSASRTDRLCKYNQLLRIEEELGSATVYAGRSAIPALAARK